ncbi:hypothetical protein [Thermosipho melanesiensis]|uniref:Uncharacterized protein n=1 Tax=Thermosipho melanesiensis (strain DSM 12029 / CIP 104789 / BI429) TaxID=391009 RepID=A6LN10_THEM4|nr:hypothetical protein [Thermosipho melanesiensis]ABR31311.1 hypothetical protein Tmel_1464 [Thermosipho melanesiensis BI429]
MRYTCKNCKYFAIIPNFWDGLCTRTGKIEWEKTTACKKFEMRENKVKKKEKEQKDKN